MHEVPCLAVDSLKALDPNRPIREADFGGGFLLAPYCALRLRPHLNKYRQVNGLSESCEKR